ncbi:MAG: prepilin-type N-terminal cleavage/methylation domain-containing protein [Alkaliphilus sp.]
MIGYFSKKINNKKGFTLIELIIVIAIIAILMIIAVPRFAGFTDRAEDRMAESNLEMVQNLVAVYRAENGTFPASADFAALIAHFLSLDYIDTATAADLSLNTNWKNDTIATYAPSTGDVVDP